MKDFTQLDNARNIIHNHYERSCFSWLLNSCAGCCYFILHERCIRMLRKSRNEKEKKNKRTKQKRRRENWLLFLRWKRKWENETTLHIQTNTHTNTQTNTRLQTGYIYSTCVPVSVVCFGQKKEEKIRYYYNIDGKVTNLIYLLKSQKISNEQEVKLWMAKSKSKNTIYQNGVKCVHDSLVWFDFFSWYFIAK